MDIRSIAIGIVLGVAAGFVVAWLVKPEPEQKTVPSRARERADNTPVERPTGPKPMYTGEDIDAARVDERGKAESRVKGELEKAQADVKAARDEADAKNKRAGELEKEVSALKKQIEEAKKPATDPAKKAPISFGKAGELAEVGQADWAELSGAVAAMNKQLAEMVKAQREGRPVPPEAYKEIQKHNDKLLNYYVKIRRKLPTHAAGNGEFVHPINIANLIARTLESAGKPLSEAQIKRVVALGEEYESGWDKLQAGYNETTLKLEKIVDELELKQKFYDDMVALLDSEQREIIVNPETRDCMQADIYSPSLMLVANIAPIYKASLDEIRVTLIEECAKDWSLNKDALGALTFIFDTWFGDCGDSVTPRTQGEASLLKTQECIRYGRAQIKAMKTIIEQMRPEEKSLALIRDDGAIAILRVLKLQ